MYENREKWSRIEKKTLCHIYGTDRKSGIVAQMNKKEKKQKKNNNNRPEICGAC